MSTRKFFCKAPFSTLVIDTDGSLLPCCEFMTGDKKKHSIKDLEYWWGTHLNDIRDGMIKDQVAESCRYCIGKENNPELDHLRTGINDRITIPEEKLIEQYRNKILHLPKIIEIRLGNYCNLKCTMCGPYASSSILQEYLQNKEIYNKIGIGSSVNETHRWWEDESSYDNLVKLLSISKSIHFGGGEPFLNPKIIDILQKINKEVEISFSTNLTIFTKKIREVLEKFNSVRISASIDGTDVHNEYIRFNSKWQVVDENIKKFKSMKNVYIELYHILQHTSLYTLPKLMEYSKNNNIDISFGEVYYGSVDSSGHLTINSAPIEELKKFIKWYDHLDNNHDYLAIKHWIDSYKFDVKLYERFKVYFKTLDGIRGTNFEKTFGVAFN